MFARSAKNSVKNIHYRLIRFADWFSQFWRPLIYVGDELHGKYALIKSEGVKLFLRKNSIDKYIFWEIFKMDAYTDDNFSIKKNDTIVDIGAQAGIFSVFAANIAKNGHVYSFEPFKSNYELLLKNKKINNFRNIHAFNLGVTGNSEKTRLYVSETNTGGHSVIWKNSGDFVEINTTTLSDILRTTGKIDYLKIDAEGSEYEILLNTPKNAMKKIMKVSLEYHDFFDKTQSYRDLVNFFKKNGFKTKIKNVFLGRVLFKTGLIKAYK